VPAAARWCRSSNLPAAHPRECGRAEPRRLADRRAEADLRRFKARLELINPDLYEEQEDAPDAEEEPQDEAPEDEEPQEDTDEQDEAA
jgi:hypothetical protein